MGWLADETGLEKRAANYAALTPLSFLNRAADVFPKQIAVVYGGTRRSYAEYHERVTRLASGLAGLGIAPGDVVATLLPNVPAHAEAHFGVPACGAVLNAINTRLDTDTVAYILGHGGAKVLLCDAALVDQARAACAAMSEGTPPTIVEVPDAEAGIAASGDHMTYDELLQSGDPGFRWIMPEDEWESLSLNYTSGTTGRPKGVVYHHRGAYLNAMGQVLSWRMILRPVYLTIVPLFHCNGWCHTWMMPAVGGTLVCCREIRAKPIFDAIADEGVTHFGGAPIVLNTLINAPEEERRPFDHVVEVFTAGAPPAPSTLAAIEPMGFNVTHVYGLTETYGPATECLWHPEWDALTGEDRAAAKARQGVGMPFIEHVTVMDDTRMEEVQRTGAHQGEIMFRGNGVMKGYYKNAQATEQSFAGGYFHSGDLALLDAEGYMTISDRAKDIIISGGENISSIEVENALMRHEAVSLCAVVAKPDDKWGEVPCAFVELKTGAKVGAEDLIAFARERLAGFKTPKAVVFGELPKTSTGKIQKFQLRERAKTL
ncbi:acyl-CoA synthetase [Roseivivax halodurans JCM 10272]|uniref:3-methylmercaptopropionyl-CoA ligase n=1 Tax=Roseivivax halodurans JCM 10272 TaxID=1449350 RepID=X7EF24_9RHOB|nr:AMP-binding protein [Roseivivax halodurans]ETX14445.1 acyl-CoA synthetase [Roseivivax halodurans JCM 10272]